MVGENWEDFFEVIIVQARKPLFFTDESRPLRIYDRETDTYLWDRVTSLKKGVIYFEVKKSKDLDYFKVSLLILCIPLNIFFFFTNFFLGKGRVGPKYLFSIQPISMSPIKHQCQFHFLKLRSWLH